MPARKKSAPRETQSKTAAAAGAERTCILVMGMHRSGTSALGGVLGLLGSDLPAHVIGGDENNQKGYFESAPLNTLNGEILEALGSRWDDWHALDARGDFPGRSGFEARARALLETEFGGAAQFVFKDPRNCRIGDFWLPLLRETGARVVALHTLRDPWEVAASLTRRDRMLTEQGLLLWLRHTLDAERLTRDLPRFHTSYDLLMQDWRGMAEQAGPALGLSWAHGIDAAAPEINAFLARDLRHFDMTQAKDHAVWDWLHETHDILRRWAQSGETAEDRARLDMIRTELDRAEPALRVLFAAADRREARLHEMESEAAGMTARIARAESGWQKASEQLADLQIRTEGVRRVDLENLEARLAQSEAALQRRQQEAEAQYREVLATRQAMLETERRVRQDLAERHQRDVMGLKSRHAQTRARLEEAEAALETQRRVQEADRKLRETLAARVPALERDLQKALSDRNRAQAEVKALRASTSWRITGPLRRVIRLVRRK